VQGGLALGSNGFGLSRCKKYAGGEKKNKSQKNSLHTMHSPSMVSTKKKVVFVTIKKPTKTLVKHL